MIDRKHGWFKSAVVRNITPHFTKIEHQCKCRFVTCYWQPCHPDLYPMLEKVRASIGLPIKINSGYRCRTHNKNVGGSERSRHMDGCAVDIVTDDFDPFALAEAGAEAGFKGIGVYKTWVHLDIRDIDARWGSA